MSPSRTIPFAAALAALVFAAPARAQQPAPAKTSTAPANRMHATADNAKVTACPQAELIAGESISTPNGGCTSAPIDARPVDSNSNQDASDKNGPKSSGDDDEKCGAGMNPVQRKQACAPGGSHLTPKPTAPKPTAPKPTAPKSTAPAPAPKPPVHKPAPSTDDARRDAPLPKAPSPTASRAAGATP